MMITVNPKGIHPIKTPAVMAIPNKTPMRVCPAVILANNRNAKVMGRANKLIISMGIMNGINIPGTPGGTKTLK